MKQVFPKIHFYDHDIIDLYNTTWSLIPDFWKKGTKENGFESRYFNYPENDKINQFEACFSSLFLAYSNRNFPVVPLLDNFYKKQEEDGAIRGEYSEKDGKPVLSKKNPQGILPPLFSWAEYNIYHKVGIKKRVREVMPHLERYYSWIQNKFRQENGLYSVPLETTMMHNSPRGEMYYAVDFNAIQALNSLYMSALSDILNEKEKSYRYKRYYFSLKTRINSLMWNKTDRFYYDLDKKCKQIRVKTIASFWPLVARIPNEERSEGLIAHLTDPKEFGLENPFPTLSAREKHFDRHGNGFHGSVFPPFTYMVIKGLERYRKYDLAREFTIRHLYCVLDSAHPEGGGTGTLWEAYCPHNEKPAKWNKRPNFPRPNFLSYAALSTISLMIENVIGLYISLPRKTVDWIIPTLEVMGIEDLSLRRNMITILSNKTHRGWEIQLESEKLYYFTINIVGMKKKTLPIPSGKCSILVDKI